MDSDETLINIELVENRVHRSERRLKANYRGFTPAAFRTSRADQELNDEGPVKNSEVDFTHATHEHYVEGDRLSVGEVADRLSRQSV